MISLNATLFVQIALFLVLLFVLNKLMIQPIHRIILEREEHLRQKREELAIAQDSVRRLAEDYEAQLRQAEREAREGQLAMRKVVGDEARNLMASAQEQVVAIQAKVRAEVAEELTKARVTLKEQAEKLSVSVTEKVLGRQI